MRKSVLILLPHCTIYNSVIDQKNEAKDWDNHEIIGFGFYHNTSAKDFAKLDITNGRLNDTTTLFKGGGFEFRSLLV